MIKLVTLALSIAALMAGCSSGVKLDDVPVEDKSATSTIGGATGGANSGNTAQSGVAGVDLGQSARDGAGPVGVARIVYFDYDSYVIKPDYQSHIPMTAVAANTTSRWGKNVRKLCVARWLCLVFPTTRWRQ